jgi:hypothetical protein
MIFLFFIFFLKKEKSRRVLEKPNISKIVFEGSEIQKAFCTF